MRVPVQRLKPPYTPLRQQRLLKIDERGFVYLCGLKLCQYAPTTGKLEFQDRTRTRTQGKRFVEITPRALIDELTRLTEALDNGDEFQYHDE